MNDFIDIQSHYTDSGYIHLHMDIHKLIYLDSGIYVLSTPSNRK